MSGLAGIIFFDGRPVEPELLERIAEAGAFRARDGVTLWNSGSAGMIRFRHATTPEALGENQPWLAPLSGKVICFDGRIDNRSELLNLLGETARHGVESPDCALVLALFERYGQECPKRLVGDYAFAIWDPTAGSLFCARSPLGWRPFNWYCDGTRFLFGTDIKPIIAGLGGNPGLNEAALGEYIGMHFAHPNETFWRGIHRLEPGSALYLSGGSPRLQHWHEGPFPDLEHLSEVELVDQFRVLFDQSIVACMRSVTPVAAHLSGGLDSSSVVCRATELYRSGKLSSQLRPVSARYPGEPHDETEWSSAVESHLGLEALVVSPGGYDWDEARAWCAASHHLPLRPNVLGPVLASARRVRQEGMDVLLTGEGGDDWLNGSLAHWPDLLRHGRLVALLREGFNQGFAGGKLRRFLGTLRAGALPWFSRQTRRQLFQPNYDCSYTVPDCLQPEWAHTLGLEERWRSYEPRFTLKSFAQQQRYARYGMARHHVNLENVLAFTESCGVELRHPLHDLRLTTFLMGVPGNVLRRNGERKYLLRQAMHGTLPEKVRTRQNKAVFASPMLDAAEMILSRRPVDQLLCVRLGWVKSERLRQILEIHQAWYQKRGQTAVPKESTGPLWSTLALEIWLREAAGLG